MIDIHKFSGKDKSEIKADILHTSAHARVNRGGQIGSTGSQSFQQRTQLSQQSRTVKDYKQSVIGGQLGVLKAKRATPQTLRLNRSTAPSGSTSSSASSSRQAFNSGATPPPARPKATFKEPSSRGYNPYA